MRHINADMAPDVTTVFLMPPRDIAFAEAQGEFTGDGLIPD